MQDEMWCCVFCSMSGKAAFLFQGEWTRQLKMGKTQLFRIHKNTEISFDAFFQQREIFIVFTIIAS